jgi:hypothetical protein
MAGRSLPDHRPLTERELVEAWRQRGQELVRQATDLQMDEGHTQEVENLLDAAEDYFQDANTLEGGIELEDR